MPIIIAFALAVGVVLGGLLDFPISRPFSSRNNPKNKLNRLLEFIDKEYVDQVNADSIVDLTVNNILAQLDPHSIYLPPDVQSAEAESMKGDFVGIGIHFYMYRDSVAVIKPLPNGPSEKVGIKAGDRILYANNTKLFGRKLPTDSLFSELKGDPGSEVELTVFRKSENRKFRVKLKRDVVPIASVDAALMLNAETGYLKINRFAESTYDEFQQGMTKLRNSGMKTFIIDLRNNGGGYIETAIRIADELLVDKKLIVFTKNKRNEIQKAKATDVGDFEEGKVYVLINENSASASEIVAGAIQDNDRGLIIGRRSFGKGLVQQEMNFEDGSAVRLTIARYFTPSGRSIQKPYEKGNDSKYANEFYTRFQNGELYEKDSIKVADSLKFKTAKGRVVYGGGGIVPDIFVPLEGKKGEGSIAYMMEQSGFVGQFTFEQLDKYRVNFRGLSFEGFLEKMKRTDLYFKNFKGYLLDFDVQLDLDKNKKLVNRYLAAEFARQIYDEEKFYKILLAEDPMIRVVLNQSTKN